MDAAAPLRGAPGTSQAPATPAKAGAHHLRKESYESEHSHNEAADFDSFLLAVSTIAEPSGPPTPPAPRTRLPPPAAPPLELLREDLAAATQAGARGPWQATKHAIEESLSSFLKNLSLGDLTDSLAGLDRDEALPAAPLPH